jgi:hypothetical protein
MGFLTRFFDRKRAANAANAADLVRSQKLSGQAIGQSGDEQIATRGRMEAELAGQRQQREGTPASAPEAPVCPHTTLVPRWDSVADMGKEEKVTSYTCDGCQQRFSPAEGRALRATEAARLPQEIST